MYFLVVKQWVLRFFADPGFVQNVAVLAGGTAVAQAITIVSAPILTRVYGPEDFGLLAVYSAVVSVGGVIATLQYHRAIPLPKSDRLTSNVFALCLALVFLTGFLATILIVSFGPELYAVIGAENFEKIGWLIPIGIVSIALYEVTTQYAIRCKSFRLVSGTRLTQSVVQNGTQVGTGLASGGPLGLVAGQLLGQILGFMSLASIGWRNDKPLLSRATVVGVIAAARRYRRFPLFTSWSAILNTISLQAPTLILSSFFGIATAGLFALGQQVLLMPVSLISKSASQVFLSEAIDARRARRLGIEVKTLIVRLSRLAFPFSLSVVLVSPEIFTVFFGESWRVAGVYCQWQALWLFMTFFTVPLSPLVAVMERQPADTAFQLALLIGRIGAMFIGVLAQNPMIAIASFGITSGLLRVLYFGWLLRIGGVSVRAVYPVFLKELTIALLVVSPLIAAKLLDISDRMTTLVAVVCGISFLILSTRRAGVTAQE